MVTMKSTAQAQIRGPIAGPGRGVSPGINLLLQAKILPGPADYV